MRKAPLQSQLVQEDKDERQRSEESGNLSLICPKVTGQRSCREVAGRLCCNSCTLMTRLLGPLWGSQACLRSVLHSYIINFKKLNLYI